MNEGFKFSSWRRHPETNIPPGQEPVLRPIWISEDYL
jgi:hypothetical protein